jgi:hypothetical protein
MAGREFERQERKFIHLINQAVKTNKGNPITLITRDLQIEGVVKAVKFRKRFAVCETQGGGEPYTDVVLHVRTLKGLETFNVSLKGETTPSLAGGGACGLNQIIPGLVAKFMKMIYARLILQLKPGDKVPDTFGRISPSDRIKIVVGTEKIGGPIHYLYIGPMGVIGQYDTDKNELTLNGSLHDAVEYAKSRDLFLYLRARHVDQRFDPAARDKQGLPKIYSGYNEPGRKNAPGRIAVTERATIMALVVQL